MASLVNFSFLLFLGFHDFLGLLVNRLGFSNYRIFMLLLLFLEFDLESMDVAARNVELGERSLLNNLAVLFQR